MKRRLIAWGMAVLTALSLTACGGPRESASPASPDMAPMEDIITIESAISETELRIEELSGSLQHYDALVDYATVQINLDEVYKLSNVEETPTGFGSRMAQAFAGGLRGFADSLEALAVALAYSWLWLLVAGLILICGVRLTRRAKTGEGLHISLKRKKKDDNGGER